MAETELPVRLIAIPEGLFQGFNDEIFDMSHGDYLRNIAIDIPGKETEELGKRPGSRMPTLFARRVERTAKYPVITSTGHSLSIPMARSSTRRPSTRSTIRNLQPPSTTSSTNGSKPMEIPCSPFFRSPTRI